MAASFGHMTALAPTAPNLVDPCWSRALPRQYSRALSTCHLHSSGGLFFKPVTTRRSVSSLKLVIKAGALHKLRKRCNVASKACLKSNILILQIQMSASASLQQALIRDEKFSTFTNKEGIHTMTWQSYPAIVSKALHLTCIFAYAQSTCI